MKNNCFVRVRFVFRQLAQSTCKRNLFVPREVHVIKQANSIMALDKAPDDGHNGKHCKSCFCDYLVRPLTFTNKQTDCGHKCQSGHIVPYKYLIMNRL